MLSHDFIDGTIGVVRAFEIARGQEELVHDLAARENKCIPKQLHPLVFGTRMMRVEPVFERAEILLQFEDPPRVDNGRVDLEPVSDDARVGEEAGAVFVPESGDFYDVEPAIGFAKSLRLFENKNPRESRLIDFEDQPLEEQMILRERKAVLRIVVSSIVNIFGMGIAIVTVGCHAHILSSLLGKSPIHST